MAQLQLKFLPNYCQIGVDINLLTPTAKWSPLDYACRYGKLEAVELLLESGAKLDGDYSVSQVSNAITGSKWTTRKIIELLLEHGAELDNKEFRPIIRAMGVHQVSFLEMLLTSGSNPNLVDEKGWNALHYTAFFGCEECIDILLKFNCDKLAKSTKLYAEGFSEDDSRIEYLIGTIPIKIAELKENRNISDKLR